MPRQPRGPVPAGIYHVTMRSAGPIPLFRDDFDRTRMCNILARVIKKYEWCLHAFCLMDTHYHLLAETDFDDSLQPGMQALNGPYAQGFNARHGRWGHLRGDRYASKPVESIGHFLSVFRYIARNAPEAGMCEQPSDWLWSSYADTVGLLPRPRFTFVDSSRLRDYFAARPGEVCEEMRRFVGDAVTVPLLGSVPSTGLF